MDWIKVEHGLPEDNESILFWDGSCETVRLGWFKRPNQWNEERRFGENVTHWMPLPEPTTA